MSDQAAELRQMMSIPARKTGALHSIAITSGKGGVGKTSIAVNLSLALAQSGVRTVLMDADWGLSNADVLLGIHPEADLRDVIAGRLSLNDIAVKITDNMHLIPGASGIAEIANLSTEDRMYLQAELQQVSTFADVVLLDTAPGISDPVIDLVAGADRIMIVTTPEPTALTDAYASAKMILQRKCIAPIGLIVNMVCDRNHAEEITRGFSRVTEKFLGYSVGLAGYVCSDPRVPESVRTQKPFLLQYSSSLAAGCVRELSQRIISMSNQGVSVTTT